MRPYRLLQGHARMATKILEDIPPRLLERFAQRASETTVASHRSLQGPWTCATARMRTRSQRRHHQWRASQVLAWLRCLEARASMPAPWLARVPSRLQPDMARPDMAASACRRCAGEMRRACPRLSMPAAPSTSNPTSTGSCRSTWLRIMQTGVMRPLECTSGRSTVGHVSERPRSQRAALAGL